MFCCHLPNNLEIKHAKRLRARDCYNRPFPDRHHHLSGLTPMTVPGICFPFATTTTTLGFFFLSLSPLGTG